MDKALNRLAVIARGELEEEAEIPSEESEEEKEEETDSTDQQVVEKETERSEVE